MSIKGFVINGQTQKYDYDALDNKPPVDTGVSDALKQALLQLANKVAYVDADGLDYYQDLYDALYGVTVSFTITNYLTDVINSNTQSTIVEGGSYTGTLSCAPNYEITSVTITMGGTDVTGTSYSSGTISIPNVTGNIVITAVATQRSATLSSISAVFTQGQNIIYDTDSLDTLKQYLVVTATWSDSSTSTVPSSDYTLSGTLEAGTSTITVSYGGKTTTFNVTVTSAILYQVKNHTVTASSGYIDTELQLLSTDRDFTIVFDGTQTSAIATGRGIRIYFCANASTSWKGIMFGAGSSSAQYTYQWYSHTSEYFGLYRNASNERWRTVYVHEAGSDSATIYYKIGNGNVSSFTLSNAFIAQDSHFLVGGADADQSTNWVGTIAECTVYGVKLSQTDINSFFS